MKKISIALITAILTIGLIGTAVWGRAPMDVSEPEEFEAPDGLTEGAEETQSESEAQAEAETDVAEEEQGSEEAADLITVEEPLLTESGSGYVDWYGSIPIDAADVEVTDEEVQKEIDAILSGKDETETDEEFIHRYAERFLQKDMNSLEELRAYIQDDLYHSKLQAAIFRALEDKVYVDSYAQDTFELLKEYAGQELQKQVDMYEWFGMEGWDQQKVAEDLGYASVEDFLIAEAMYYGNAIMLLDDLAASQRVTYNDEEVENAILDLMGYYGYDDEMTLEEYIEYNGGDPWLFMVEKLNVEYHKVLSEMEQYAVIEKAEDMPKEDVVQQPAASKNDSPYTSLTNFTATTIDGDKMAQDLFAGKDLTILNVWATWCGFCIDEMPDLAEYAAQLPDNIQLVTLCTDGVENESLAREILEQSGLAEQDVITLVHGTDDLEKLNSQVIYLPTSLFFNSKGEIVGGVMIGGQQDLKVSLDGYVQDALGSYE